MRLTSLSFCLSLTLFASGAFAVETPRQHPLVSLPITSVRIEDHFWAPRIEVNSSRTLEAVRRHLVETGAIDNLAIAAGKKSGKFRGPFWSDSDVYKWIEGVSYSLAARRDPGLEAKADDVIGLIAAAQMKSGYLDTYFQLVYPEGKWKFMAFGHEMFCAGHLYEAAVAHYEVTGKHTLLDVAMRHADHIASVFGPGKRDGQPGHEVVELALVKLYRVSGDKKYLKLAQYFLDQRGRKPSFFEREYKGLDPNFRTEFLGRTIGLRTLYNEFFLKDPAKFDTQYSQDHLPVREQDKVVGHAVRAMYLYSGMADVAGETGDQGLFNALLRLYSDLETKRIYLTGGIGPSAENEGFTRDYDLPNETAYQETCASIGVAMWTQRMLALTGDSKYADSMELSLYNAFPAGVSLDGDTFFYDNPLYSAGKVSRKAWFPVPCCPTNVARIMPSLGKFIYSQSDDALWINLYVQSTATTAPGKDGAFTISQHTEFPWFGTAKLTVAKAPAGTYDLRLRIPSWAGRADIRLNGTPIQPPSEKGYAMLGRHWTLGDTIDVSFSMPVQLLEANPNVLEDRGKVALRRGPLIYCFEQIDNKSDIDRLVVSRSRPFDTRYEAGLLKGMTVITGKALLKPNVDWEGALYRPVTKVEQGDTEVRAVPYSVWANRGSGKMAVWVDSDR